MLRSPEVVDKLRKIYVAEFNEIDKEVEELRKALDKTKVGTEPPVVGLWTSQNKKLVRKVYKGRSKGCYYKTDGDNKRYLDDDEWVVMSEADVEKRIAAHEDKGRG